MFPIKFKHPDGIIEGKFYPSDVSVCEVFQTFKNVSLKYQNEFIDEKDDSLWTDLGIDINETIDLVPYKELTLQITNEEGCFTKKEKVYDFMCPLHNYYKDMIIMNQNNEDYSEKRIIDTNEGDTIYMEPIDYYIDRYNDI